MKVFENKKCAIWMHFELGEPWWFELIDLQNKRNLCKDFIKEGKNAQISTHSGYSRKDGEMDTGKE